MKSVEDTCPDEEKPPVKCPTPKNTCKTGNSCVEATVKTNNNNNKTPTKQKCEQNEENCIGCDAANSPPWLEANSRKGGGGGDCRNSRNSSEGHNGKSGNNSVSSSKNNSGKDCECEGPPNAKQQHNKKNGYYNGGGGGNGLYKNAHYNTTSSSTGKRNGYNDCRNSPTVGPRFSRYENQQQQQQQQQQQNRPKEPHQKQPDQCVGSNITSCTNGTGRGRITPGKKGGKQTKVLLLQSTRKPCYVI